MSRPLSRIYTSLRGMRRAGNRWLRWLTDTELAPTRIWIHGASVGEALVAKPILTRLRDRIKKPVTAIHTFTSPSVVEWQGIGAERQGYLPTPAMVARMLAAFHPQIIIYPRADLWPQLVRHAQRKGVRQVVVGGSLSSESHRLRLGPRIVFPRPARYMTAICTVSDIDHHLWERLGAPREIIRATGDPRDDEILEQQTDLRVPDSIESLGRHRKVLVAGSVHWKDVPHILSAVSGLSADMGTLVVPHDPSPDLCSRILALGNRMGIPGVVWRPGDGAVADSARLVIVQATGLLRRLYGLGSFAYVGGGFDTSGVHSIAEAAAWGIPVVAGPASHSDPDARRFISRGGAHVVSGAADLKRCLQEWVGDEPERLQAGSKARGCLDVGAADRTTEILLEILEGSGQATGR